MNPSVRRRHSSSESEDEDTQAEGKGSTKKKLEPSDSEEATMVTDVDPSAPPPQYETVKQMKESGNGHPSGDDNDDTVNK